MSAAWGNFIGVITVLIMLTFIGIWLWAWLPHHKRDFDRLARLPMDDEASTIRIDREDSR